MIKIYLRDPIELPPHIRKIMEKYRANRFHGGFMEVDYELLTDRNAQITIPAFRMQQVCILYLVPSTIRLCSMPSIKWNYLN
jgi:hypothetical protein